MCKYEQIIKCVSLSAVLILCCPKSCQDVIPTTLLEFLDHKIYVK